MKKRLIQIALMLVACCVHGQGTFQYDQQSGTNEPSSAGFAVEIQSNQPFGQSFVPSLSSVDFIRLYMEDSTFISGSSATVYVNLLAGSITGTVLSASSSVTLPGNFFGYTNFVFSTPVSVTPGTTYYFQPVVSSVDHWRTGIVPGFNYSNGNAFFQGIAQPGSDLWFREGIVVPEPSPMLLALLGMGRLYFCRFKANKK